MLLKLFCIILFNSPFIDLETSIEAPQKMNHKNSPFEIASLWFIALHQNHLTHIDGPRSHFVPCSSKYMKEALIKHGFFKGSLLGLDRLLRENNQSWVYPKKHLDQDTWVKVDPVP